MNSRVRAGAAARGQWPIVLRGGDGRARVRPWWNDPSVAQLTFIDHGHVPSSTSLRVWLGELRSRGFVSVRTGAVTDAGADTLHRQGFDTLQTLRLLDLPLIGWRPPSTKESSKPVETQFGARSGLAGGTPAEGSEAHAGTPVTRTRRLRTGERQQAAEVDRAAFGDRWAIDVDGIDETCEATPSHRARTIDASRVPARDGRAPEAPGFAGRLAGYAVTGRADRTGYLQRLAVHPDYQGRGLGYSLTRDSLVWMQRRRLSRAVVNTHSDNDVALQLYQGMGFRLLPQGLSVMTRTLADI